MIDKNTVLFGLIGERALGNTLIPQINKQFEQKEKNGAIVPMNIKPQDLAYTLNGLRRAQLRGVVLLEEYQKNVHEIVDFDKSINGVINLIFVKNGLLEGCYVEQNMQKLSEKLIERISDE